MQHSRRQILRGACGAALALPFLPSLLSKEALAKAPQRPPRLLWLTSGHGGAFESSMFPKSPLTMMANANHQVAAGPLTATVQGATKSVSPILSAPASEFSDKLLGKMNVLRGLDIPFYIAHHTGGHLGNYARNDGNGNDGKDVQATPRPTIDQLIGWSPSFYPNLSSIKQRVMAMGPVPLSWTWSNPAAKTGTIDVQKGATSSRQLFSSIFVSSTKPTRAPIVDQVLSQYKSLRNGNARLSSDDRQRLDDHIAHLNELERKVNATANCGSVTAPTDDAERHQTLQLSDGLAWANLFVDVAVAAFVCGTSRIGVLGCGYYQFENALGQFAGDWHQDVAHQWNSAPAQQRLVAEYQSFFANIMLKAAAKLDGIANGSGGTLLDDTLLVWTQESGVETHGSYSIPVVTFGSAAGAFKTGLSCDYRKLNDPVAKVDPGNGEPTSLGLLYNRWLATVCQGMGLSPAEFELWGHKGVGVPYLTKDTWTPPYAKHYGSITSPYFQAASDPLPFIWA
jgi:Protein of unknown function (DUF1552)